VKQWETSDLYREVKSRPSEDGSLPFRKASSLLQKEKQEMAEAQETDKETSSSFSPPEGINTEARRRCLHLLEYSPRTVYQLKKRLIDDGFSPEQAEDAVAYAKSFGYVDDGNYAMEYVRTACQKKSKRQLYMQLSRRGVDSDSIEEALDAYSDEQENTVRRLAQKRLRQKPPQSDEDLMKAVRSLVSKGFPYEMAKRAVWELRDEFMSED
jgi:regulatory protein